MGPDGAGLDAERHFLDGSEADVATYLLTLDSVNFGSGWWPTLRKREVAGRPVSGYFTVAWGAGRPLPRPRAVDESPSCARCAPTRSPTSSGSRADHELMALFAQALRQLGTFLGERSALDVVRAAGGSAVRLAEALAGGMAMFADRGFYKRAQIVASDLALAGVAGFGDLDRLTIFADNLVPHVLRVEGVLVYDERARGAHRRRRAAAPRAAGTRDPRRRRARLRAAGRAHWA